MAAARHGELPFGILTFHRPYALDERGRISRCAGAPAVPRDELVSALSDGYLSWATDRRVCLRPTAGGATSCREIRRRARAIALTHRFVYITTRSAAGTWVYRAAIGAR